MHKEEFTQFEIGEWVMTDDGLAQVLLVRAAYVERYSIAYLEGSKVGTYQYDTLICKLLCDYSGKIRKRNRLIIANSKYTDPINQKYKKVVEEIKKHKPEEYRAFVIYDEKGVIGESLSLYFSLSPSRIEVIKNEIETIKSKLPNYFTLREFAKIAKEIGFSLDLDESKKYMPGSGAEFNLIFFSPLCKTINKQHIYSKVWYRVN